MSRATLTGFTFLKVIRPVGLKNPFFVRTIALLVFAIVTPIHAQDLGNFGVQKSINYDQSSASAPTFDPEQPYQFSSYVNPGATGTLLSTSTIRLEMPTSPPSYSSPFNYQSGSNGLQFQENFQTKAAMDAAVAGAVLIFQTTVSLAQNQPPNTYVLSLPGVFPSPDVSNSYVAEFDFSNNGTPNPDNYPAIPQLVSVTNATWSGGYLVITNPALPVTFTWNAPNGAFADLNIEGDNGISFNDGGNVDQTSTILPGGTLTTNAYYHANINFVNSSNGGNPFTLEGANQSVSGTANFQTQVSFTIKVGTPPASQTYYGIRKGHVLVQTSNSAPEDGSGNLGGFDPAPYNFAIETPIAGTVSGPGGKTYTLGYQASGGNNGTSNYTYSSGPITSLAALNTAYRDGTYVFHNSGPDNGDSPSLIGGLFPNTPKVTLVNGAAPVWNSLGQLVLDPTIDNTITWTAINATNANFATNGHEDFGFSSNAGDSVDIEQRAGISETSTTPFNTILIPANTMTDAHTYVGYIDFDHMTDAFSLGGGVYEYTGYQTTTYLTAVAATPVTSYYAAVKENVLVQTSSSNPANASGNVVDPAPYNFNGFSPVAGSITGPGAVGTLALIYNSNDNGYEYRSSPITTLGNLNTAFPDGNYTLADGNQLSLSGSVYPNAPKVTLVNGSAPTWNGQGQLVLDPTIDNTITWNAFTTTNGSHNFSNSGHEDLEVSGNNVDLKQEAFGPGGDATFNTYTIPAFTLAGGNTYTTTIGYLLASGIASPSSHVYDAAGYETEMYFSILASASGTLPQTIAFADPGSQVVGGSIDLSAVDSDSGLPVSFVILSGSATFSGGQLYFNAVGPVTVQAYQAGDSNYAAATPVTRVINVTAANDLGYFNLQKSINYDQASASAPTLHPHDPYQFSSSIGSGGTGNLLSGSTLTPPSGGTGNVIYQAGSNGLYFQESFATQGALDAAFPNGTNGNPYNFSIETDTPSTYMEQLYFGSSNYPVVPQITNVTNATWTGGHLLVTNPALAVTFTWTNPNGAGGSLSIDDGSGNDVSGNPNFQPGVNQTTYTLPGGTLVSNSIYHGNLFFYNSSNGGSIQFSTDVQFDIRVGTPVNSSGVFNGIQKKHVVMQTSNSAPADGTGALDRFSAPSPYDFQIESPVAGTVAGPNSTSIPLLFDAGENNNFGSYAFLSAAISSQSVLDSTYPNGTYTMPNGKVLSLTGNIYPNAPQVTLVNGHTPVWNSQGQLVLDASVMNTITWAPFNVSSATFASSGHEDIEFADYNYSDIVSSQRIGVGESNSTAVSQQIIPANAMAPGHTYIGDINYALLTTFSGPVGNVYSYAGYETENVFTIVAVPHTGLPQTITFPSQGSQIFASSIYTLSATASSGLPVSYGVVSAPGSATINGNTVTFGQDGSAVLQASQPGGGAYAAATPVNQNFTVDVATDVDFYGIQKIKNFDQSGASTVTPDPEGPYQFGSNINQGSTGALLSSSTLTPPSGSTGTVAYQNSTSNNNGLNFNQSFITKAAMDAAFAQGTYNFVIQTTTPSTYHAQVVLGADNYPSVIPQVLSATNATWVGNHLKVTDPTQPVMITWPTFISANGYINYWVDNLNIGNSTNADGSVNSFTIPANSLSNNTAYQANISFSNIGPFSNSIYGNTNNGASYSTSTNFTIEVGTAISSSATRTFLGKSHVLVQISNSAPVDGVGDKDGYDAAPYNFSISSPVSGTVTGPASKSYTLAYNVDGGNNNIGEYRYSSGTIASQSALDSASANGSYTLPGSHVVSLTGNVYPDVPKVLLVNGVAPVWNAQGQLVLDPTVDNVITCSPFAVGGSPLSNNTFAATGHQSFSFYSNSGGDVDLEQDTGITETSTAPITTITIPAYTMSVYSTYVGQIGYALATAPVTGSAPFYIAGYETNTFFTAVAQYAPQYVVYLLASNQPTFISNGFNVTGNTLNATLNFAPSPGTVLTVLNNTGSGPIIGNFNNLPDGGTITILFHGSPFTFTANYEGGDGNDLVLTYVAPPSNSSLNLLHSFLDGSVTNDGSLPVAALTQGSDGNFYGTTQIGGSAGYGTAFKIDSQGVVTILHSFGDGSVTNDGNNPEVALVQGTDGNFYGTTDQGGSAGLGTAFKMTPQGAVTILHHFGDGSVANDGNNPEATLTLSSDGNFYGTTQTGGSIGYGTVFKMTPAGTVTILHSFQSGTPATDGSYPEANLYQGSDGNFYGTTEGGGAGGSGTVFKITPGGTLTLLHSFGDGSVTNDGNNPTAGVIQSTDGNFYGTTSDGGVQNHGTIFKITPQGTLTNLHNFGDGSVPKDGVNPEAALLKGGDGNFYGTTEEGGSAGGGVAFKITPQGVMTILHNFGDGSVPNDGNYSVGALLQGADGNFYGTTTQGGIAGDGTIFKLAEGVPTVTSSLTINGTVSLPLTYQTVATNTPTSYAAANLPAGLSINAVTGLITGTPSQAGTTTTTITLTNGSGSNNIPLTITISPLPVPVVTSILYAYGSINTAFNYHLTATNGANSYGASGLPDGLLIDSNTGIISGNPTTAGVYPVSLTATNSSGDSDETVLTISIFNTTPTLSQEYIVLHNFDDNSVNDDGQNANGIFKGFDGTLYGITTGGGGAGNGTIFNLTVQGETSIVNSFGAGNGAAAGVTPVGLIQAADGNFYGTANSGGTANFGTVFRVTPQGTVTVLHSFGDGSVANDGKSPMAGLIQGADGNFYGTTSAGGSHGTGAIYKITPQGAMTLIYSLGSVGGDGATPKAGVIQGLDGDFYGTTSAGGANSLGAIFKIHINALGVVTETILHSFGAAQDGASPVAPLLQGTDGNFYGTTQNGGSNGKGTVFRVTSTGTVNILHSFSGATGDGAAPVAPLIQGFDGNFYGTTSSGGTANSGTAFQMIVGGTANSPTATVSVFHNFGDVAFNNDGTDPITTLYQGSDGNFYGTTSSGGDGGNGTVFAIVATQTPSLLPVITGATIFDTALFNPVSFTPQASFGTSGGGAGSSIVKAVGSGLTKATSAATYWTLTPTPPAQLMFDSSSGTITGSPTVPGTYVFQLTTTNAQGTSAPPTILTFYVDVPPTFNNSQASASGTANTLFTYPITATAVPYLFGATDLPAWLSVNTATGVVSGIPPGSGSFNFSVSATNKAGTATQHVILTVTGGAPGSPAITSPVTASITAGIPFSYQITATNSPTSFGALSLPPGLVFNTNTGLISGTPTTAGTFHIPITAINGVGPFSTYLTLTIVPLAEPVITSNLSVTAPPGASFNYQITATGIVSTYGATGLPPGLSIDPLTGLITGTPTATGVYHASIFAGNGTGNRTATLQLTVANNSAGVTLGNLAATYDGTAKVATATTSPAGLNVTFKYNGSSTPPSVAGSYTVDGTINDAFYQGHTTGTLVISPALITATAKAGKSIYGQDLSTMVPGLTVTGLLHGDTVTSLGYTSVITGTGAGITPTTDAGSYKLTIGGSLTNHNYALKTPTATPVGKTSAWTVSQDILTVNSLIGTSVFGQTPTAPSQPFNIVSSNGVTDQVALLALLNGTPGTSSYNFNITNGTVAGKYATNKVTSVLLAPAVNTKNYKAVVGAAGTWTVTADTITITGLTTGSSTYGSTPTLPSPYVSVTDQNGTASGTLMALLKGVGATLKVTSASNVGTYSVAPTGALNATNPNYKVVLAPGSWKVNPQPVTVTILPGTSVYGAKPAVPILTATGNVGGKSVPLTNALLKGYSTDLLTKIGPTGNSGANSYTVDLVGMSTGNYMAANPSVTAQWTVTPATITGITVNKSATSVFGTNPADKALTIKGLVNGDLPSTLGYTVSGVSGKLTASTNVGTYTFTVGGGLADGNYVLHAGVANPPPALPGSKIVITPALLTVTLLNGNSNFGTTPSPGAFSYSVSGFVNGDTTDSTDILLGFTVKPPVISTTPRGAHKLTPVAPATLTDPNYKATKLIGGVWTVN